MLEEAGFCVVGEAGGCSEAMERARDLRPQACFWTFFFRTARGWTSRRGVAVVRGDAGRVDLEPQPVRFRAALDGVPAAGSFEERAYRRVVRGASSAAEVGENGVDASVVVSVVGEAELLEDVPDVRFDSPRGEPEQLADAAV